MAAIISILLSVFGAVVMFTIVLFIMRQVKITRDLAGLAPPGQRARMAA